MKPNKSSTASGARDDCHRTQRDGEPPLTPWLVVNTHPHKERFAIENLGRQAFETYCPQVHKVVRHARRSQRVLRPLFPGYLFVEVKPGGPHWRPIASTFGVRSVVQSGVAPGVIDGGFITALKGREVDGAIVLPETPYAPGEKVKLTAGAFDGLVATILELDEKGRITVLLELLNQGVKVRTDVSGIRKT